MFTLNILLRSKDTNPDNVWNVLLQQYFTGAVVTKYTQYPYKGSFSRTTAVRIIERPIGLYLLALNSHYHLSRTSRNTWAVRQRKLPFLQLFLFTSPLPSTLSWVVLVVAVAYITGLPTDSAPFCRCCPALVVLCLQ